MREEVGCGAERKGREYVRDGLGGERGESLFGPLEGTDEEINERQRVREKGIR